MRVILSLTLALWASMGQARSAETNLAQDGLKATIEHLSTDVAAHGFEIGMLQTLRAVEKTLQARYEYGLGQRLAMLPLLRLDTGGLNNPSPKPSNPGTLSDIMQGFVADIATARASLEGAQPAGIEPFEMTLGDIWFDINANGTREEAESAMTTLGAVVLGRRAYQEFASSELARQPLTIRFDRADHAWLLAYTHMLSGFGNLFLAFDPEPVLRDLKSGRDALKDAPEIPNFYDLDAVRTEIEALQVEKSRTQEQLDAIRAQIKPIAGDIKSLRARVSQTDDETKKSNLQARIDVQQAGLEVLRREERQLWRTSQLVLNEIAAAQSKLAPGTGDVQRMLLQQQPAFDAIYVAIKALSQEPDKARIRAVHAHLSAMVANNRVFWTRLAGETDNDREWIPNATQVSALPLTIPPRLAEGWQNILLDIEAVLEGKLLIPHPGLPEGYGISLPAYVDNPTPLDLVNWLHGIGAYRHAARGPLLTNQNWQTFQRLSLGNAGGFALLFN